MSLGLMRALRRQGMKVQPFSCGPDLADKAAHEVATGCASVNLDAWYASRGHIQYLYNTYGEQADVCVVDNSAGLFDGFRKWQGSGADIAQALSVPVILLANARSSTYSLAYVVRLQAFQTECPYSGRNLLPCVFACSVRLLARSVR